MKQPKKILSDHKKVGSKFIPPMMGGYKGWETSFFPVDIQKDIVPEIIWIAYIIDEMGFEKGTDLFYLFVYYIEEIFLRKSLKDFCSLSNYEDFSFLDFQNLRNQINHYYWFDGIRECLKPFNEILPENPLNKLFLEIPKKDNKNIDKLKNILEGLNSKRNKLMVFSLTSAFCVRNNMGKIMITESINLPSPITILDYPDSEDSLRLASFIRAGSYSSFKNPDIIKTNSIWNKEIWNYTNSIEPLQINSIFKNG
ncbi:hypothetical protein [Frigoriflavimonas asaccharolytica]|uniref:Uncharacterized protein n=1 Tax=Frigoriflavimonas asaccharolytica TaxID=2735899 RepID=A0A8J8GDS5_9FLAO|nr:hypothetical protein [Frigoriflavimonas asaccharolytica]NRS94090.1 hypothetical protein [Frigoriflavimonas asaccharolytica]